MIHDALIVGGGPAGAAAATMLARGGWRVAVVEKSEFPRRKVCGEFISATSITLLRQLGIDDAFAERAGPPIRRVALFAGSRALIAPLPRASDDWGRALGREHLDTLLLEAAASAGAELWQPWRVTDLRRAGEGFACTLTGEMSGRTASKELTARTVIAANGSWERGPSPLPHERDHRPSDLLAFKAHFRGSELPQDLMPLLVFPGGYGGMVHTDGGRMSLSCCIRRDALQACRNTSAHTHAADALLEHIERSCLGARHALAHATLDDADPKGPWLSAGPIQPGIRSGYADGIFRIGNLAGEAHPIVAEGISMALQSAWLLCRHLIAAAGERAAPDIARAYEADWRASFAMRIRAAAIFAHVAVRPNAVALLLPLFAQFPRMLTFGALLAGKSKQVVT